MEFYDALNWRYATKKMNGQEVPKEKLERILDAIQLAPTSMGLQPFEIFLITDPELKEQIHPIAYNQNQITESSHLLVFTAWDSISEEQIDDYVKQTSKERDLSEEELQPLRDMLEGTAKKSDEEVHNWSARQLYIALGFGLAAAAVEEVDATPMEGFNPDELDELLDLRKEGLKSISLLALGYRDAENDWLAPMKKVRRPKDELFINPEVAELV
jgi:nitroreductase